MGCAGRRTIHGSRGEALRLGQIVERVEERGKWHGIEFLLSYIPFGTFALIVFSLFGVVNYPVFVMNSDQEAHKHTF